MQPAIVDRFLAQLNAAFRDGDPDHAGKKAEAANIARLEAQYRAIGAGDYATALAMLADDVEMEIVGPAGMPFAGKWKGLAQVADAIRHNFSLVADQDPHIESVTAQGDTVVIVARERGRYVPTGGLYELHWVQVFQFRAGKVVRFREVADTAAWLAATRAAPGDGRC